MPNLFIQAFWGAGCLFSACSACCCWLFNIVSPSSSFFEPFSFCFSLLSDVSFPGSCFKPFINAATSSRRSFILLAMALRIVSIAFWLTPRASSCPIGRPSSKISEALGGVSLSADRSM